ncbi:MAG: hypothetical protein ABF537_13835, partial [Acetobacter sp.]|uniref:hypothetical protein n=1 Tax=Acetobacter sp. TaxID=440 RepID=UPI0039ECE7EF
RLGQGAECVVTVIHAYLPWCYLPMMPTWPSLHTPATASVLLAAARRPGIDGHATHRKQALHSLLNGVN